MKKLISLICMLTCVLCLSACSAEPVYTEYQQQKNEEAENRVQQGYVPILSLFMDDGTMLEAYKEYTPKEIEAMFASTGLEVDGNAFMSAAESFYLNYKSTGTITVDPEAPATIIVDKDSIIVRVQAKGEKKDAEIEVILSNDIFCTLKSAALNPVSSKMELIQKAGLNTLLGMGTVFVVLILISLIISCFSFIPKIQKMFEKKEEEKSVNEAGIDNAVAQITQQEEVLEESDDLELVAVISAAIAAYEGSADTSGYVVRSIRKVNR